MFRIDRGERKLVPLPARSLADAGLLERSDIQRMILQSADDFFNQMGESLKILGEEIRPADFVSDRIDLLALDPEGAVVILELKRASHKLHLLQALSYAAMISKWTAEEILDQSWQGISRERTKADIEDFLDEGNWSRINQAQRVVLLAEEFDFQVLATADWLSERFKVDIRCYRMSLASNGEQDFLSCTRIYPPPELEDNAKRKGGRQAASAYPHDWPTAMQGIESDAVRQFYLSESKTGCEGSPARRLLRYRIDGRVRYRLWAKQFFAYVSQKGRFDGDIEYWATALGDSSEIKPIHDGKLLRFRLRTEGDFHRFKDSIEGPLQRVTFEYSLNDNDNGELEDNEPED